MKREWVVYGLKVFVVKVQLVILLAMTVVVATRIPWLLTGDNISVTNDWVASNVPPELWRPSAWVTAMLLPLSWYFWWRASVSLRNERPKTEVAS